MSSRQDVRVHVRAFIVEWDPVAKCVVQHKLWHKTVTLRDDFALSELCKRLDQALEKEASE